MVSNQNLNNDISDITINEYVQVIEDYNIRQEIKRLEDLMRKEPDELEKAKIAERIRELRIGGDK